ncbi:MAG: acylphosphatase [Candidatus Diapherotrites archaeon]|nr:acylphosphatase [Candidatus Diapherotrites archaeon]
MADIRLHALLFGRVQGIGFRFFVQFLATGRKLKGFVRNLPDRSVEIVAVGSRESLESFWSAVQKGHPLARIEKYTLDWEKNPESFKGFQIRY